MYQKHNEKTLHVLKMEIFGQINFSKSKKKETKYNRREYKYE